MEQVALDFDAARRERDRGMQRALDHADRVTPEWGETAFSNLIAFLRATHQPEFRSEEVRAYAAARGMPDPPDKRAWGAVLTRAAKSGLIVKVGYTEAKDPKVHRNPVSLWRRAA